MLIGLIKTIGKEKIQCSAHYNLWTQLQMKIFCFSKVFLFCSQTFWLLAR